MISSSPRAATIALLVLLAPASARSELEASFYAGGTLTANTTVRLTQPGGTDLELAGVAWNGESFVSPIYYAIRIAYWPAKSSAWGISAEFIHDKLIADLDRTVTVTGTRAGDPVDAREPLRATFRGLSFSHGHNLLLMNAQYRWPGGQQEDRGLRARLEPHVGSGVGIALPHVEVDTSGTATEEYQMAGFAWQAFAGVDLALVWGFSASPEYKLSYARIDGELSGGGTVRVRPWTHHLVIGLSYRFL